MIRIDLSRDEIQKQKPANNLLARLNIPLPQGKDAQKLDPVTVVIVVVAFAAAALPTLFVNQYKNFMIKENESQIAALKKTIEDVGTEIERLTPYRKELESYEVQKKQVRERLDIIRQLQLARGTPVNVLDAIGQSLPAATWLKNLSYETSPTGTVIKMDGLSLTNEEISDFVDKLSESVYFNDVVLKDVAVQGIDGVDGRQFHAIAHPKERTPAAMPGVTPAPEAPVTPPPGAPPAGTAPEY